MIPSYSLSEPRTYKPIRLGPGENPVEYLRRVTSTPSDTEDLVVETTPTEPEPESEPAKISKPPAKKRKISTQKISTPYSDSIANRHDSVTNYEESLHRGMYLKWCKEVESGSESPSRLIWSGTNGTDPDNFTFQRYMHIVQNEYRFLTDQDTDDPGFRYTCYLCKQAKTFFSLCCKDCKTALEKIHFKHMCVTDNFLSGRGKIEEVSITNFIKAALAGAVLCNLRKTKQA
jgi:hypothetical protein